jgi:hypothetical protein
MQNSHLIQALTNARITEIHRSAASGRLPRHAAQNAPNRRSAVRRPGRRGLRAIVLALAATGALTFGATAWATVRTDGIIKHPSIAVVYRHVRVDGMRRHVGVDGLRRHLSIDDFRRLRRQSSALTHIAMS